MFCLGCITPNLEEPKGVNVSSLSYLFPQQVQHPSFEPLFQSPISSLYLFLVLELLPFFDFQGTLTSQVNTQPFPPLLGNKKIEPRSVGQMNFEWIARPFVILCRYSCLPKEWPL